MTGSKKNNKKRKVIDKNTKSGDAHLVCSFCGKPQQEVGKLILLGKLQKPICKDCIGICNQILDDANL